MPRPFGHRRSRFGGTEASRVSKLLHDLGGYPGLLKERGSCVGLLSPRPGSVGVRRDHSSLWSPLLSRGGSESQVQALHSGDWGGEGTSVVERTVGLVTPGSSPEASGTPRP